MTHNERKVIGYGKLGRSLGFTPSKFGYQGDAEAPQLLKRLAERNPDVYWVIISRNDWKTPAEVGLPANVINPWVDLRDSWKNDLTKVHKEGGALDEATRLATRAWYEEHIVQPWTQVLDGMCLHIGQHGTTNIPIAQTKNRWSEGVITKPLDFSILYTSHLCRVLNVLGDKTEGQSPVSYICTDPRNYFKARDVKWPTGLNRVLAQYSYTRTCLHDRQGDLRTAAEIGYPYEPTAYERGGELWRMDHTYRHANLELMILPDDWSTWGQKSFEDRKPIGVASTSYFDGNNLRRRSWWIRWAVIDRFPDAEVYGPWDKGSVEADLADGAYTLLTNKPSEFPDLLGSWRVTLTLPPATRSSDGALWTTAKPFQCMAAGVAAFMAGSLDGQGWILPARRRDRGTHEVADGLWSIRDDWTDADLHLARWLRVDTPDEFAKKAAAVSSSRETWEWFAAAQRDLLRRRWDAHFAETVLEHQLGLTS